MKVNMPMAVTAADTIKRTITGTIVGMLIHPIYQQAQEHRTPRALVQILTHTICKA